MDFHSSVIHPRIPIEIISVNASHRNMIPAPEYVPRPYIREVPAAYRDPHPQVTQDRTKNTQGSSITKNFRNTQPQQTRAEVYPNQQVKGNTFQQVIGEPPSTGPRSQENTGRKVTNKF